MAEFDEEGNVLDDEGLPPVSIEDRARAMGWKPQDEYRGDPRRWTDAEAFIAHGEAELPILRDQNRRMSEKLVRFEGEVGSLRTTVAEQAQAVKDAVNLARRADERGYQRGIDELKQQQREAASTGDLDTFDKVDEQIKAAQAERQAIVDKPVEIPEPTPPKAEQAPETTEFLEENPWMNTSAVLRNAMIAAHQAVMQLRPNMPLAQQYATARAQVVEAYPVHFPDEQPAAEGAPRARNRLRLAATLEPSAPVPIARRGASPFDRIEDVAERTEAKAAFDRIAKNGSDMTAEEYVSVYLDPHQDALAMRANRKKA